MLTLRPFGWFSLFLLLGCGGSAAVPEAEVAAVHGRSAAEPARTSVASPREMSIDDVARALYEADSVLYSPRLRALAYGERHSEEGAGFGLSVRLHGATSKTTDEPLVACGPVECSQEKERIVREIVEKVRAMNGGAWQKLDPIDWAEGRQEVAVPALSGYLRFRNGMLLLEKPGASPQLVSDVRASEPHRPSPLYVVVAPDGATFAVMFHFDPGSAYAEGYNAPDELRVFNTATLGNEPRERARSLSAPRGRFVTLEAYCADYRKREKGGTCERGREAAGLTPKGKTFVDAALVSLRDGDGGHSIALALRTPRGWFVAEDGAALEQHDGPYRVQVLVDALTIRNASNGEEIVFRYKVNEYESATARSTEFWTESLVCAQGAVAPACRIESAK